MSTNRSRKSSIPKQRIYSITYPATQLSPKVDRIVSTHKNVQAKPRPRLLFFPNQIYLRHSQHKPSILQLKSKLTSNSRLRTARDEHHGLALMTTRVWTNNGHTQAKQSPQFGTVCPYPLFTRANISTTPPRSQEK